MSSNLLRLVALALCVLPLGGCDMGFQKMEAGEYGVVFVQLPRWLGGGVRNAVVEPGEMEFILPWQRMYRVDTTYQLISWGSGRTAAEQAIDDSVETRTIDGNEVGLAITVQYHVDPTKVRHVVQKVGTEPERIKQLVAAVARADIRTHMNTLATRDFFSQDKRQNAVEQVRRAMQARLEPEGIIVDSVIYKDHRFERYQGPGQEPDRSYQEQIDRTQAVNQETLQEEKRRAAIVQAKGKEQEEIQGQVNRLVESAKGVRRQSKNRGDSYRVRKENEAAQVVTAGMNEVEGMRKRIEALSGPGGEALLRLEIANSLTESKPRFVLINSAAGGNGGIGISKIDQNELIRQSGIFAATYEGLKDEKAKPESAPVPPSSKPQ
ncbi:MAG: hypothetical protein KDD69_16505 [Bdellovibrionales bacterium]|nr:hypothetical protein [Bdellovibrionales bacterium]